MEGKGSVVPSVMASWCRSQARRIAGSIIAIVALVAMYIAEHPANANIGAVAQQFAFSRHALPEVPGAAMRYWRELRPSLRHLGWFMSAFGAAASLNDLDGDGLPNDVCYVD